MKRKLRCLFGFHQWVFLRRTDDWLRGGTYHYVCLHCPKTMETRPYQGGEY